MQQGPSYMYCRSSSTEDACYAWVFTFDTFFLSSCMALEVRGNDLKREQANGYMQLSSADRIGSIINLYSGACLNGCQHQVANHYLCSEAVQLHSFQLSCDQEFGASTAIASPLNPENCHFSCHGTQDLSSPD